MKKHLFLHICLLGIAAYTYASSSNGNALPVVSSFQSQQFMQTGSRYGSTIYTPFDNTTPSEQQGKNYSPSGPKRVFDTGAEHGQGPSPIGEPWILAFFAAGFAGVIAYKRARTSKKRNKTSK